MIEYHYNIFQTLVELNLSTLQQGHKHSIKQEHAEPTRNLVKHLRNSFEEIQNKKSAKPLILIRTIPVSFVSSSEIWLK